MKWSLEGKVTSWGLTGEYWRVPHSSPTQCPVLLPCGRCHTGGRVGRPRVGLESPVDEVPQVRNGDGEGWSWLLRPAGASPLGLHPEGASGASIGISAWITARSQRQQVPHLGSKLSTAHTISRSQATQDLACRSEPGLLSHGGFCRVCLNTPRLLP